VPLADDARRWPATVDRLRTADTASHDGTIVHGPVRVVPLAGKPAYFQAAFRWHAGSSPVLARVTSIVGDSVRTGPTLAAALGLADSAHTAAAVNAVDLRTQAESLYRDMREALRRGDWEAFGRSFDALGATLRPAPR
jgi:uncharacterized membrane protein (UPF0182 family)